MNALNLQVLTKDAPANFTFFKHFAPAQPLLSIFAKIKMK